MEHPNAPAGKALKYALVERERRFLLREPVAGPCLRRAEITDLYLSGTRVRLRRTVETTAAATSTVYKLTQKIPAPTGGPGFITTLYLDEAEHAALSAVPGLRLVKTRYSVPPFGIDVFTGELAGLVLAEVEFVTAREHDLFAAPRESAAEVTLDHRLTGGHLVQTGRAELLGILADYGLEPVDAASLASRPLTSEQP